MARSFNGSSDYLQTLSKLDFTSFHTVCVSFNALVPTYRNIVAEYFLQFYDGTNLPGAIVFSPETTTVTHQLDLTNYTNNGAGSGADEIYINRPSAAAWHNFLFCLSNTNSSNQGILAFYIDGAPATINGHANNYGSNTFGNNFLTFFAALTAPATVGGFCAGDGDQLAIWTATAGSTTPLLTATDAANIAAAKGNPTVAAVQPTYYWPIGGWQSPEPALIGSVNLGVHGTAFVAGPSNLAAGTVSTSSVTATTLTVSTTAATGGTGPYTYQFQRAPDVGGSPGTFASVGTASTSTSFGDTGLTASTKYWYRCISTDANNEVIISANVSVTTTAGGGALTAGTVSTSSVTATTLTVSTTSASGGTAPYNYQFQRAPDASGSPGTFANVGPNSTATSFNDSGRSPATKYWYQCVVTDSVSAQATSNQVSVTMDTALAAGTLSTSNVGSTTLTVTTTAATHGTPGYLYQFQRAPDASGSPGTFANVGPNSVATSFNDSSLTINTTYWYRCVVTDTATGQATSANLSVTTTSHAQATSSAASVTTLAQSLPTQINFQIRRV